MSNAKAERPPESPVQSKGRSLPSWAIILIFILGMALGFCGLWLYQSSGLPSARPVTQVTLPKPDEEGPPVTTTLPLVTSSTRSVTDITNDEQGEVMAARNPYLDYILSPVTDAVALNIDWSAPKLRNPEDVWRPVLKANQAASIYDNATSDALSASLTVLENNFNPTPDQQALGTWHLGKVADGKFAGYTLYEQRDGMCDLGGCADFRFIVSPDGQRAISVGPLAVEQMKGYREQPAEIQSAPSYVAWENIVIPDFNLSFSGTAQASTGVTVNHRKVYTSQAGSWDTTYMDWLRTGGRMTGYVVLGQTDDGRPVYGKEDQGCAYVQAPDRTFLMVASKILMGDAQGYEGSGVDVQRPIVWDEQALGGKRPAKTYLATGGGCDTFCPVKVEKGEDVSPDALLKIGLANGDEPVYMPKDMTKSPTVKLAYDSWFLPDGKDKPSFDEFLKQEPVPVFFWQDAFGRWMRYMDSELSPPAECGKPVIYLYPTKTTSVSVQLPGIIHVTVSDPAYGQRGWQVVAHPDGQLTLANGQKYGSLYWEGNGVGYATPRQGFVIKDGEQAAFLSETLAKYGLDQKEAKEFMDFWLPKLTGAPYYRISFLTDKWSAAAPLYVNPKPDTSIRLFMDWRKLSAPVSIAQPQIKTPERKGFTLVEWGGLLYNN